MTPGDALTLVPRVKSFTNKYVTKAYDSSIGEDKIKHLAYIIFDSAGNCVDMAESDVSSTTSLTINKTKLNSSETSATVVLFANVKLEDIKKENTDESGKPNGTFTVLSNQTTLSGLDEYSIHFKTAPVVLSSELSSFDGFPMKGVATGVNLTTASNADIEVSLQILYAKISFDIDVAEGTENQNLTENGPSFSLSSYSVHNVSQRTPVTIAEGEATPSTAYAYKATGKSESGTNNEFTFYMAESRYTPKSTEGGKIDLTGIYPNGWTTQVAAEDVKGYTEGMENQLNGVKYFYDDLIQQYKPILAAGTQGTPSNTSPAEGENAEGLAAYVLVNGTYVDYRGTLWDVNYKVYLGKDNAHDFHVDRNSEYKNYLTIKGIRNNDSYTEGESVWIDHRVHTSTNSLAGNVTITRETLIDSHIEVRPLRVTLKEGYSGIRLVLPDVNWIAAERFTGNNCLDGSIYCYDKEGNATGKRKYFTSTLISDLKKTEGTSIILLDDDCAWIYFDDNVTNGSRTAEIILEPLNANGEVISNDIETYTIVQSGLLSVGDYAIESYEEYLHTYDSADKYDLTTTPSDYTQEGFAWDLNGSNNYSDSLVTCAFNVDLLTSTMKYDVFPKYDYFHEKDDPKYGTTDEKEYHLYKNSGGNFSKLNSYNKQTGLYFTNRAAAKGSMSIKDMGTEPESAYQYCLSKNKFIEDPNGDNHMLDIHWYLPDVHELKAVVSDKTAADLSSSAYYWSSQPSMTEVVELPDLVMSAIKLIPSLSDFNINTLKKEDESNARAVSASSNVPQNQPRANKNRIRCFYSAEGIGSVSMSGDRTPEGIGGVHSFYMKAWGDWSTQTAGYFKSFPVSDSTKTYKKYELPDTYAYPKTSAHKNLYFGDYLIADGKEWGFEEDPSDPDNWDTERVGIFTSQVALHQWPGLTTKQIETNQTVDDWSVQDYYVLNEDTKEEKKSATAVHFDKYSGSLVNKSLNPLAASPKLSISFSGGNNAANGPRYEYYKETKTVTTDTTRTWVTPKYQRNDRTVVTPFSLRTPSGQIQLTSDQQTQYDGAEDFTILGVGYKKSRESNSSGYIYTTEAAAIAAGQSATSAVTDAGASVSIPSGISKSVTAEKVTNILLYTYYTKKSTFRYDKHEVRGDRYRYRITYSTEVTTPYYTYKEGGDWSETYGKPTPVPNTSVPTQDELRIYCGNSFTISVDGDYEITKVKVYCSGNNYIRGTDGVNIPIVNYDIPQKYYYARFVESSLPLPSDKNAQLQGMDYEGDFGENTSVHQWVGAGKKSVTLVLADYFCEAYFDVTDIGQSLLQGKFDMNNILKFVPYDYQYVQANTSVDAEKNKSIVIDRIEVKCTKATSATPGN